jgi:type I restriction enzyme M protein
MVEIIEPFHGRILDPACGSGGMFVQSARFVAEHKKNPSSELSIFGVEKTDDTGRLCRMNLAVHGLEGDIRHGGDVNSYYDDPHKAVGAFDFALANPPFNVNAVDKDRLKDAVGPGRRFPFGLPRTDNANYLWIQLFYSALNEKGRAAFVMANSASDARSSEMDLRKQLIQDRAVDAVVAVGPNMFYTVTLPCTLWFLDRGKKKTPRADKVLFVDARHIYRQIDRAHRDWSEAQVSFLANVVRLYRGEQPDFTVGGAEAKSRLAEIFAKKPKYADVAGLCKAATLKEIEAQGWSLNPGRYVGVAPGEDVSDTDRRLQQRQPKHRGDLQGPRRADGGADRGAGSARARALERRGTDHLRHPDASRTDADDRGARRGQESRAATARTVECVAGSWLASKGSGSRGSAACDRGRTRRGAAARLHKGNLPNKVQCAVRARVRIIHG